MKRGEQGFTLVETLLALALLALMSAYAVSAIRIMRNVDRLELRISERAEIEAVQRHLITVVSDARTAFEQARTAAALHLFQGGSGGFDLISVLDDHLERGGLYRARYYVDAEKRTLMLSYKLLRGDDAAAAANDVALLSNVKELQVRYFGTPGPGAAAAWTADWSVRDRLPQLVEIAVVFEDGDNRRWPLLLVNTQTGG
jgi:prepilin-type N-terminal cleavage/methylation domain-containing protein